MANTSVTINFGLLDTPSEGLALALNSEDNDGKSDFFLSESAKIRLYNPYNKAVSFVTNKGSVSFLASGLIEEKEGYVTFAFSDNEQLSDLPLQILSHNWMGANGGAVSFSGRNVSIPTKGVFVLYVKYTVTYSIYTVTSGGVEGPSLVVAHTPDGENAQVSPLFEVSPASQLINTFINVKDYCTDELIDGAFVTVSGNGISRSGNANSEGKFDAGLLPSGKYDLVVTATGYLNSGDDALHNDSFTIPFTE